MSDVVLLLLFKCALLLLSGFISYHSPARMLRKLFSNVPFMEDGKSVPSLFLWYLLDAVSWGVTALLFFGILGSVKG